MNIEKAKAVPLALILETLGCKPAKERGHKAIYLSPLRAEKTPSFHVNNQKNLWYDFGNSTGGSIIEFVCAYLKSENESSTVSDALRWIQNMAGQSIYIKPVSTADYSQQDSILKIKKIKPIKHPALINYLKMRGIPLGIASEHIEEASVHNTESKKDFFALAFKNEEGGYEIRNPFFKGCIGKKSISFIRGKEFGSNAIHIFEGFIDYLSAIADKKQTGFNDDTIVLNSLSCLRHATPYIKDYGYKFAYTWLDNDTAGDNGTKAVAEFCKAENNLQHKAMNDLYSSGKDVNAWYVKKLSL